MKMNRKTALIWVDLQKNLTVEGGGNYYPTATEMIDRVARRINEFRDRGVQIVYIWSMPHLSSGLCSNGPKLNPELAGRMVPHPEWGRELDDRLTVKEEDWIIRKFTYSAFWNTPLLEKLQQAGVENVLVCRGGERARERHQDECLLSSDGDRFREPQLQDVHGQRHDKYERREDEGVPP